MEIIEKLQNGISFRYTCNGATRIPSKLTATQLKGRDTDTEIADGCEKIVPAEFRKPMPAEKTDGRSYGNVIHTVLQYIPFDRCDTVAEIRDELKKLVAENRITPEQADMVDCEKIVDFFKTQVGGKLKASSNVLREFKFSVLEDASKFYADAEGEQILFQGVVDCAILEDDGIIVLDFKTDYVTEDTIDCVAAKYKPQVTAYADALSRIYKLPIKSAMLYFFAVGQFVDVI